MNGILNRSFVGDVKTGLIVRHIVVQNGVIFIPEIDFVQINQHIITVPSNSKTENGNGRV